MRSKFVQDGLPNAVFDHLKVLQEFDIETFKKILKLTGKIDPSKEDFEIDLIRPVISEFNITVEEVNQALAIVTYFHIGIEKHGDSLDDILSDLVDLNKINAESLDNIKEKFNIVKEYGFFDKFASIVDEAKYIGATFPIPTYIGTRCSVATVFEKEFNSSKDDAKTYESKIKSNIPVTVVQIDINQFGKVVHFSFALSEKKLNSIIDHLLLAKKQLEIFKKHINL